MGLILKGHKISTGFVMLTVLALGLSGCIAAHHPIPVGTYARDGDEEFVSVSDKCIFFHVRAYEDRFIDRTYGYTVGLRDGSLVPGVMTSTESLYGIGSGRYRWYWDGSKILRVSVRTWDTVGFQGREPARQMPKCDEEPNRSSFF